MDGFVWNNGIREVMWTFTPEQLPVLNGLARAFAVSDEWFCSMPGATDSQRAFAAHGLGAPPARQLHGRPPIHQLAGRPAPRVDLEGALGERLHRLEDLQLGDVA